MMACVCFLLPCESTANLVINITLALKENGCRQNGKLRKKFIRHCLEICGHRL